jgi:hypothetical protein
MSDCRCSFEDSKTGKHGSYCPVFMQDRIAELETDRNEWRKSAETLGREVALLREQLDRLGNGIDISWIEE